jgi:hypothetical protein
MDTDVALHALALLSLGKPAKHVLNSQRSTVGGELVIKRQLHPEGETSGRWFGLMNAHLRLGK